MLVKVILTNGYEYTIDLKDNSLDSMKELSEILELAPGRMLKTDDSKTYVQAKSIVVVKEV